MENTKEIIEINGIKFEVDLRSAKRIEEYHVGDVVKVLIKQYGSYKSCAGTIVGFDAFKELPTIIVAYVDSDYNSMDIKFIYYNAETKDVEICLADKNDLTFTKETVIDRMNQDISKKKAEIAEIEKKRDFFINNFSKCFNFS